MRTVLLLVTIAVCGLNAQPGGGGPPNPCGDLNPCIGLTAGAACYAATGATQSMYCGTCGAAAGGCGNSCIANGDQSGCEAAPTCTKQATTNGEVAQACGSTRVIAGDALKQPTVLTTTNGFLAINMTVKLANWNATAFSATTRLYCISTNGVADCSMPGPTIRMKPGDRINLTLYNELPPEVTGTKEMNTQRLPNTVNIHTHGLHVDPSVDNVVLTIAPGASRLYSYDIPTTHLAGTHWYHSHVHGGSALQVLGGMSGVLVVDPLMVNATYLPDASVYNAMPEHILHITHVDFCSCNDATGPFSLKSYPFLQAEASDTNALAFHNFQQASGFTETQLLLVNGQWQPVLSMAPGEWHRLELVSAQGELYMEVEVLDGIGTSASAACTMRILAKDGVFLRNGPRSATFVLLPPAGRVSVAVQCASAGTYYLQSVPRERASNREMQFQQNLVTLSVSGADNTMTAPSWTQASFTMPYYLNDLNDLTSATYEFEIGTDQTGNGPPATHWLGVGQDCTLQAPGGGVNPNTFGACAYQAFDHAGSYRFAAPTCSVVDMVLRASGRNPHPIHMHVFPFQVISYTPSGTDLYGSYWGEIGDWHDTMPALSGVLRLRFRSTYFIGQIMIHCHLLHHEDGGMMDRWWSGDTTMSACTATSVANNCDSTVPTRAFDEDYAPASSECPATQTTTPAPSTTPAPAPTIGGSITPAPVASGGAGVAVSALVVCVFVLQWTLAMA